MRNQTEFLAEIYDRYEKNKRIRNKKYIKTAVSFCLFAILGAASLPILNQPRKSAESDHFTHQSDMPSSYGPIIVPTSGDPNAVSNSAVSEEKTGNLYERFDFGTIETTEEMTASAESDVKDINSDCIEFATKPLKKFIYPFCTEEISSVTLRNGKGGTYTLTSKKNIELFYDYFCRNGVYFVPASQEILDTNETYTVEFQCYVSESKIFYIRGLENNTLSLMKALQENE